MMVDQPRGKGNFQPRKLSDQQVREIRNLMCDCAPGARPTLRSMAAKFGVSHVMIHKIAAGQARRRA